MKKGARLKKNYELILFGIIFLSVLIGLVIATKNTPEVMSTDGKTTLIVKEDQPFIFNLTINNSFSDNLTRVNITINSTFAFEALTNGTSASNNIRGGEINVIFTNTTTVLSWVNLSSLALPDTNESFWFNATASTRSEERRVGK